jgi:hypothetical protein
VLDTGRNALTISFICFAFATDLAFGWLLK